jgi:hypothetical protein
MWTVFWPFNKFEFGELSHMDAWLYDNCQASMCGDHQISPSVQESAGFCRQFICYYLFFPVLFPNRRKQSRYVYRVLYLFSPWLAKLYKCSSILSHMVVMRMRNIRGILLLNIVVSTTEVKVIGQTDTEKTKLKFVYRNLRNFDANTTGWYDGN